MNNPPSWKENFWNLLTPADAKAAPTSILSNWFAETASDGA